MKNIKEGLTVFIMMLLLGCITQNKVNGYLANHPDIAKENTQHYINNNKPFSDSIKADILDANPCPQLPTTVAQGSVDTSKLMKYLLSIGCTIDTSGDEGYLPTAANAKSNIITGIKQHLHPDTMRLPPDPRIIQALNIHLQQERDSINARKTQIAVLNKGYTDLQLSDKQASDIITARCDKWQRWCLITWGVIMLFGMYKVVIFVRGLNPVSNIGDELLKK